MTHDFSDLTPPDDLILAWDDEWLTSPQADDHKQFLIAHAARWGAEQAAERLRGQWPELITRPPTEADADDRNNVYAQNVSGFWYACRWNFIVHNGRPWRHTPRWQPPAPPTLREQAIARVQAAVREGLIMPSLGDLIIRALEADS